LRREKPLNRSEGGGGKGVHSVEDKAVEHRKISFISFTFSSPLRISLRQIIDPLHHGILEDKAQSNKDDTDYPTLAHHPSLYLSSHRHFRFRSTPPHFLLHQLLQLLLLEFTQTHFLRRSPTESPGRVPQEISIIFFVACIEC